MELSFIKHRSPAGRAKITVQKIGRLGFSSGAMNLIKLEEGEYAKFGKNEDGELFMIITKVADDDTFNIASAGRYSYINAKSLLQDLGIDYKSKDTTIFDIDKYDENTYKMTKRVIKKK